MSPSSRVWVLCLVAVIYLDCFYSATIPRSFGVRLSEEMVPTPQKKPFCNAFTGCGRKRSLGAPGVSVQELMGLQEIMKQRQYADEDTLGPLNDSESTVDDISRQILSEAKLWEAIQEAVELARRKQKENGYNY